MRVSRWPLSGPLLQMIWAHFALMTSRTCPLSNSENSSQFFLMAWVPLSCVWSILMRGQLGLPHMFMYMQYYINCISFFSLVSFARKEDNSHGWSLSIERNAEFRNQIQVSCSCLHAQNDLWPAGGCASVWSPTCSRPFRPHWTSSTSRDEWSLCVHSTGQSPIKWLSFSFFW